MSKRQALNETCLRHIWGIRGPLTPQKRRLAVQIEQRTLLGVAGGLLVVALGWWLLPNRLAGWLTLIVCGGLAVLSDWAVSREGLNVETVTRAQYRPRLRHERYAAVVLGITVMLLLIALRLVGNWLGGGLGPVATLLDGETYWLSIVAGVALGGGRYLDQRRHLRIKA